jgi:tRNA-Thr(GGU) m(6)t(6)A37 methyltransferase TsaA
MAEAQRMEQEHTKKSFQLYPVGKVDKTGRATQLRIFGRYADALKGLEGFSHVFVLYWFDRNDTPEKRSVLQVHPRGDRRNPLTGVFATRAPVRPNLIALSLCKIVSVKGNVVEVERIDAFDGSPILDLKPYIPSIDSVSKDIQLPGWLKTGR